MPITQADNVQNFTAMVDTWTKKSSVIYTANNLRWNALDDATLKEM